MNKPRTVTLMAVVALSLFASPAVQTSQALPSSGGHSSGGVIVWTHRANAGSEHLLIARSDGSSQRELTPAVAGRVEYDAQVSPDGAWVAYGREEGDSVRIRLVRPDGSDNHEVTVPCPAEFCGEFSPTWLSSKRIAFSQVRGPFDEEGNAASAVLFGIGVDGDGFTRLSQPGIDGIYEDQYLRVSARGDYRIFKRLRTADLRAALFRADLHGRSVTQITPWSLNADVYDLSTAQHGASRDLLVFESYGRGTSEQTYVDLAVVPATCPSLTSCTRQIRWLTDNAATGRRNANPQWSPDGRSLVFTDRSSIATEDVQIWTQRFPAGQRRLISTSPDFDYRPAWGVGPNRHS